MAADRPNSNQASRADGGLCDAHEHEARPHSALPDRAFQRAVTIFKSLADERRLRTLELLHGGDCCGSEIAATFDEPLSTVSHRMKLLETAGLVVRERRGRHIFFRLADEHVLRLVRDALDHAME